MSLFHIFLSLLSFILKPHHQTPGRAECGSHTCRLLLIPWERILPLSVCAVWVSASVGTRVCGRRGPASVCAVWASGGGPQPLRAARWLQESPARADTRPGLGCLAQGPQRKEEVAEQSGCICRAPSSPPLFVHQATEADIIIMLGPCDLPLSPKDLWAPLPSSGLVS